MHPYFYGHSEWQPINDPALCDKIRRMIVDVDTPPEGLICQKRPLPFYQDTDLVLVKSPEWEVKNLFVYFISKGDTLVRLDGTSPPLHAFNAGNIRLTPETAQFYLEFFCFFVRGEEGPFLIVDSLDNPYLPGSLRKLDDQTGAHYDELTRLFRKPRAYEPDGNGNYRYSAMVFYSNAMFIADFLIKTDGMIEMKGDDPVMADLPHKIDAPIIGAKPLTVAETEKPRQFEPGDGRRIAYHQLMGRGPGIVFLGGFKSDMEGSKALYLQGFAKAQNREFLRFDYTGHGQSSGEFTDGCIGDWARDAIDFIRALSNGPQVIVGSSMGGWIALLLARAMPEKVAGLVTIAAAPDFTEDSMWAGFDAGQRAMLQEKGRVELPSEYDEPYVITRKLIEDGRKHLVLRDPLDLPFPTRFLQGTADRDVDPSVALRLLDHAAGDDIRLTLVKGADHRFSDKKCLGIIGDAILQVS